MQSATPGIAKAMPMVSLVTVVDAVSVIVGSEYFQPPTDIAEWLILDVDVIGPKDGREASKEVYDEKPSNH